MTNPYEVATKFAKLFSCFEHALKRTGFLRNSKEAQADWNKFARELGPDFFRYIVNSKMATTLIDDPPRKLMKDGLNWKPESPTPLKNEIELFEVGVCRVRNSLIHGEKFVGSTGPWERDVALVSESYFVLGEAQTRVPRVAEILLS